MDLSRIKALVIKEFLAILRDKKSRLTLIAPPLIQLIILSQALTLDVKNISLGIYTTDPGWYSHELIERIQGAPYVKHLEICRNEAELKHTIDTQKSLAVIRFPSDFSRLISKGKPATVQIILDGRKSNASQSVMGYLGALIETFNEDILKMKGVVSPKIIAIQDRSFFNPNLDYIYYTVPCLVAMLSMILALTLTAMSISRERENGTFNQLLVSPLKPWEILVGKTVPALVISVAETTLLMGVSLALFNVPFVGSVVLLYVGMIVFLLSTVGIGLFISALSSTQQQSILGAFIFMTPTIILSGYATPIENMPEWLQPLTNLIPITHFFVIIKGVFLKNIPALEVWNNIWPMALIAVCTLSFSGWMFKRRLE